ncbi:MAG: hypothetical protein ABSF89_17630 [Acidimicrobiales bacterium]|jgi:hypothetical protein
MIVLEPRQTTTDVPDAEALIKEARQRQRRRRLVIGIVALIAMVVSGVSYALVNRPSGRARPTRTSSPTKTVSATQSGSYVSPKAPTTLVVAPNGGLLVVDSGRDQILRRLPSGKFQVLAGDGKRGFSGDGGPAVDAELHLDYQAGIAVARNGTVYFADALNGRVREVLPDGIIKTVAGGGTISLGTNPVPALSASFGGPFSLFGLAMGPNGQLYIGTNGVYRLSPDGVLHWVVGKLVPPKDLPKGWGGVYSNPAIQSDFMPATRLAFDGKGDLLVAGGGGWGLYEMTKSGKLLFLETFRGDGYWGSLSEASRGSVVLSYGGGIFRFSSTGTVEPIGHLGSAIDSALGRLTKGPHMFIGGDGVAVSVNGDIYVDTNVGNTFTSVSAILELRPNGSVVPLWKS